MDPTNGCFDASSAAMMGSGQPIGQRSRAAVSYAVHPIKCRRMKQCPRPEYILDTACLSLNRRVVSFSKKRNGCRRVGWEVDRPKFSLISGWRMRMDLDLAGMVWWYGMVWYDRAAFCLLLQVHVHTWNLSFAFLARVVSLDVSYIKSNSGRMTD